MKSANPWARTRSCRVRYARGGHKNIFHEPKIVSMASNSFALSGIMRRYFGTKEGNGFGGILAAQEYARSRIEEGRQIETSEQDFFPLLAGKLCAKSKEGKKAFSSIISHQLCAHSQLSHFAEKHGGRKKKEMRK